MRTKNDEAAPGSGPAPLQNRPSARRKVARQRRPRKRTSRVPVPWVIRLAMQFLEAIGGDALLAHEAVESAAATLARRPGGGP